MTKVQLALAVTWRVCLIIASVSFGWGWAKLTLG